MLLVLGHTFGWSQQHFGKSERYDVRRSFSDSNWNFASRPITLCIEFIKVATCTI